MILRIFTVIFILFLLVSPVHAQEPATYNDAFLQYNLKMEDYDTAHEEYVLRRSQYIRFKTLQSENDARAATVKMLQARDDVVIAYITALKKRMEETKGISDEKRNVSKGLLDAEIAFFKDHRARIPSTGTLDDLVADSKLAKDAFDKDKSLFYQTLFEISGGKLTDLRTRTNDEFVSLKEKIEKIRGETRPEYQFSLEKMQAIDRFVFESENKLIRADDKRKQADDLSTVYLFDSFEYSRRLGTLGEAQQLLKEATSFLKEIVNQIKRQ